MSLDSKNSRAMLCFLISGSISFYYDYIFEIYYELSFFFLKF